MSYGYRTQKISVFFPEKKKKKEKKKRKNEGAAQGSDIISTKKGGEGKSPTCWPSSSLSI